MHEHNERKLLEAYRRDIDDAPLITLCDADAIHAYCEDSAQVMADAIADGVTGEPYVHYFSTKGRFNGKTKIRHKPLNNMDLYVYAKRKFLHGEIE